MRGGIAERGGVRVGHRIIEINGTSVVATAHEKIVEMLSTSVGEVSILQKKENASIFSCKCCHCCSIWHAEGVWRWKISHM